MEQLHGGDIYRNTVEYDFSVNVNPLGMPRSCVEAAKRGVELSMHYPDCQCESLCGRLAQKEEVSAEWIVPGNGAAELLYSLCYAIRPKKGLIPVPAFLEYERALLAAGGVPAHWYLEEQEDFRIGEGLLAEIEKGADILFLCNPGNPTGAIIEKELLDQIVKKCRQTKTILCMDECFLPFLRKEQELTMKPYLEQFPNLVILRALTKIYAMPGLRLGYMITADRELSQRVKNCMQPWNISLPAQMAGCAALEEEGYVEKAREMIARERNYLTGELSGGLADKVYPSEANYIFFKAGAGLKEAMLKQGILIRSCENYENLSGEFYRIAVRTHEENMELIRRWKGMAGKWQNQS